MHSVGDVVGLIVFLTIMVLVVASVILSRGMDVFNNPAKYPYWRVVSAYATTLTMAALAISMYPFADETWGSPGYSRYKSLEWILPERSMYAVTGWWGPALFILVDFALFAWLGWYGIRRQTQTHRRRRRPWR